MRFLFGWALLASTAALAGGTIEGTITVTVGGKPVSARNALIYVDGYKTPPPDMPVTVKQAGRTFTPAVAAVVFAGRVQFVNDEPIEDIFHHVFTPSGLFKSKLFKPREQPYKPDPLIRLGRIDVFCDIHKNMYATLWVVPNDRFTVIDTDGDVGKFRITDVKPGTWTLVGWHRAAEKQVEAPVTVVEGKTTTVNLAIEGDSKFDELIARHSHKDGKAYEQKPDGGYSGELSGTVGGW